MTEELFGYDPMEDQLFDARTAYSTSLELSLQRDADRERLRQQQLGGSSNEDAVPRPRLHGRFGRDAKRGRQSLLDDDQTPQRRFWETSTTVALLLARNQVEQIADENDASRQAKKLKPARETAIAEDGKFDRPGDAQCRQEVQAAQRERSLHRKLRRRAELKRLPSAAIIQAFRPGHGDWRERVLHKLKAGLPTSAFNALFLGCFWPVSLLRDVSQSAVPRSCLCPRSRRRGRRTDGGP